MRLLNIRFVTVEKVQIGFENYELKYNVERLLENEYIFYLFGIKWKLDDLWETEDEISIGLTWNVHTEHRLNTPS